MPRVKKPHAHVYLIYLPQVAYRIGDTVEGLCTCGKRQYANIIPIKQEEPREQNSR